MYNILPKAVVDPTQSAFFSEMDWEVSLNSIKLESSLIFLFICLHLALAYLLLVGIFTVQNIGTELKMALPSVAVS